MANSDAVIEVRGLECRYQETVVLRDVSFTVPPGEILVVAGPSGCGKSTLLKNMIGLHEPYRGDVFYFGQSFTTAEPVMRRDLWRQMGILYQSSALWSAMTVAENVALPLQEYTQLSAARIAELVRLKLAFVGLQGAESRFPAELSGGMRKRAGLARALALDPKILFFDEPSAGLDPLSARNLDQLIVKIRAAFGTTVVVVSHELDSIFSIADRVLMLDTAEKTVIAVGAPRSLLKQGDPRVREFLSRGGSVVEGLPRGER
jgi:phospholipid/cholesterol/gamma-HCH transport system ATP-binding protein